MPILELIWAKNKDIVLRLLALRLLKEKTVKEIIGNERLPKAEMEHDYSFIMGHDSYKRIHGRLRQTRWAR